METRDCSTADRDDDGAHEKFRLDDGVPGTITDVTNDKLSLKKAIPQAAASVVALSSWFCIGMGGGFSAVLLPQLASNSSSLPVTDGQASWIASLLPLSTWVGSLAAAYLVELVGRRDCTKIQTIPVVASWATMAWAGSVETLYISRILIGISSGMGTCSAMYVAEISHPSMRAALSNLALLLASSGTLVAYVLGALLDWRTASMVAGCFPLFTLTALCFVPESPRWLLAQRRKDDAKKAVYWLYKSPEVAAQQWSGFSLEDTSDGAQPTLAMRLRNARRPAVTKPIFILFGFFVFQQLSGVYVLLFYTVDVFERVGSGLNPFTATVLVGVVRVTTSGVAVVLSRHIGRRPLAVCSGLGMTITMVTAGTCLYLAEDDPVMGWVSLACVLLYMFASAIGFLCLPWSMTAELLPLDMRGVGSGLCNTINHLLMFAVLKMYPTIAVLLHGFGVMWFFAAASLTGTVYVFFFLPETFGKSLLQIEAHFTRPKQDSDK